MIPDPFGPGISQALPAKWAVLQVLTKGTDLTFKEVRTELEKLGYLRKPTVLRGALRRIEEFGLAVRLKRYRRNKPESWKLTERGRGVSLSSPKKTVPMFIQTKIEEALKTKTSWVFVADLATELSIDKTAVGGALRKLFAKDKVIRKTIPGYRRLWALKSVYDSSAGPFLTVPPPRARAPRTKNKKATAASARPAAVISGTRNRAMCLPTKPTLVKAVTDLVKEKVTSKATFSAHDITKELREKILVQAKGLDPTTRQTYVPIVDPSEGLTVYVQGISVPKIEHEDVKEVMSHLFNTGEIDGYSRDFNGTFMEYSPAAIAAPPAPASSPTDPDPTPAPTSGGTYDGSSVI